MINSKIYSIGDIVEYEGATCEVTYVWDNNLWCGLWYDLRALIPIHPEINHFQTFLSCPSYEVKLIKKKNDPLHSI